MGVNSLWDILGPSARPVRLEALSRKKLAVDASIWIYQFLKAVRDQEGNSMPQAHIVGFFRRICKLLYFGIYPIFVFDGGAPALKRQTINQRRERREGKKESKEQTARKLLAIQVHRKADQAKHKPKDEDFNDEIVYLEDLPNLHPLHGPGGEENKSQLPPEKHSKFVKKDEYHLPELKKIKASNDDLRIMPEEEFDELAKESFDNVNGVDINTVDPNSKEFGELPLETQYMVLSHLRLRSRLRMGFNKDQLENLFPNSMDFSKFQIQQVQKRNFYTQKLMNVSGMGDEGNATRRIAGDKDRKYALVRNEDGWTLALDENGSSIDKPIALDSNTDTSKQNAQVNNNNDSNISNKSHKVTIVESDNEEEEEEEEEDDDVEWDDVPLEGNDVGETEEEKDVQKAIIESIYNMYEDKNSDDSHSAELRQAIESSKKDLLDLKIREEDMILNGILNWRNDLMMDNSQEHHDDQKNETELKPLPDLQSFSFGQSMLFQNGLKTEADDIQKSKSNNEIPLGRSENKKDPKSNVLNSQKQIISNLDNPKNVEYIAGNLESGVVQLEDELTDMKDEMLKENNDSKSGTTTTIKNQPLPLWFNEEISQMGNYEQETFVPENDSKKRKYQEDEEVGLISWNEAKDMMGDDYEKDYSDDSIEEVQFNNDEIVDNNDNNTSTDLGRVDSTTESTTKITDEDKDKDRDKEGKAVVLDYDFEEKDEEQFIEQMKEEENEHEMFKSHIRANHEIPPPPIHTSVTDEQLLQEKLQKAKRDSDEVTETMIRDVQELLRRFGIPYITAPMEAEAQCAELLKLNLVDGIVTDDSDCFLFGGDKVYKNMFNQKQYVECYIMNDINSKMGLSQEKLIDLALLLGSDYTEGIKGIGPVMAMEILAEFGSLKKFKQWFDENTKTTVPPDKSGLTSIKRSLLNRIKNGTFFLPESFPDNVIFDAYKQPEVDHDKSEFKWGVPSLDQIRSFLMYNVSWSQARVDEVMVPLIRDMNRKKAEGTQSTISEFFPQDYIQTRKEIGLGKRMKTAAQRLNKNKKG